MAVVQIIATLGANDASGNPLSVSVKQPGDPIANIPAVDTVDTDVTTLVDDGASPTQAHVTTLDTDWGAFKTALTSYQTAYLTGDVTVSFDASAVATRRELIAALREVIARVEGGVGGLTP